MLLAMLLTILLTISIKSEVSTSEGCTPVYLLYKFGNCGGTSSCPNEVSPPNIDYDLNSPSDVGTESGQYYTETGSITDSGSLINNEEPDFLTLSLWLDPYSHARFKIFNIEFTMMSNDKDLEIDDGINDMITCDACFDTSPGIHNFIIKMSTPYHSGENIMMVYRNGETVFASSVPQLEFSTSTVFELDNYSQEERLFKLSLYLGDICYPGIVELYENGYAGDDSEICFLNGTCSCYGDVVNVYKSYIDVYNIVNNVANCSDLVELINDLSVTFNLTTTNILEILIQFQENTETDLTTIINILNQLSVQLNYNVTTLINILNQFTCDNCNQTEILSKLDRNFEKLELIISLLQQVNCTDYSSYFGLIIEMLMVNEEHLTYIINILNGMNETNVVYFNKILTQINNLNLNLNVSTTTIITLIESIACGDCNQTLVLEKIHENFVKLELIITLLKQLNSTDFDHYFHIIINLLNTNEENVEFIINFLLKMNTTNILYYEQILDTLISITTQIDVSTVTIIELIESLSCGECNQTLVLEKIQENTNKLIIIIDLLKSANFSSYETYFNLIIQLLNLHEDYFLEIITLLKNNTQTNLEYFNLVLTQINVLNVNLNVSTTTITTLIESIACGDCNQTLVLEKIHENFVKLELIITLLKQLNSTDYEHYFHIIINLLNTNEENVEFIINFLLKMNTTNILYYEQILDALISITTQIDTNTVTIIELIESLSCGNCNQTELIEHFHEVFDKLIIIIDLLKGMNSTFIDEYFSVIIKMININQIYLEEIIHLLKNNTQTNIHNFNQVIHLMQTIVNTLNVNAPTIINLINSLHLSACNKTDISMIMSQLEIIINLLKGLNTSYHEHYFQMIVDIINEDIELDITYFTTIINVLNKMVNETCPNYEEYFQLIFIYLEDIKIKQAECCCDSSNTSTTVDECTNALEACEIELEGFTLKNWRWWFGIGAIICIGIVLIVFLALLCLLLFLLWPVYDDRGRGRRRRRDEDDNVKTKK